MAPAPTWTLGLLRATMATGTSGAGVRSRGLHLYAAVDGTTASGDTTGCVQARRADDPATEADETAAGSAPTSIPRWPCEYVAATAPCVVDLTTALYGSFSRLCLLCPISISICPPWQTWQAAMYLPARGLERHRGDDDRLRHGHRGQPGHGDELNTALKVMKVARFTVQASQHECSQGRRRISRDSPCV